MLLELSEPSLYAIHQELSGLLPVGVEVVPVLGSAAHAPLVERCFKEQRIEVVFHAAAYKHVPLVEANPLAGLANNVLSTRVVCAARRCGSRQLVLISTDKAVRPTNVMGASKRLAELVVQAQPPGPQACDGAFRQCAGFFRLGCAPVSAPDRSWRADHADPSGDHSLFHDDPGGRSAAQAAAAEGGDVLLLDMGEPRIKALAEQMVRLGLSLKDGSNPNGDIEIVCTGLRPGEKLFEELLIDTESESTSHPLIFRAQENSIPPEHLWPMLAELKPLFINRILRDLCTSYLL